MCMFTTEALANKSPPSTDFGPCHGQCDRRGKGYSHDEPVSRGIQPLTVCRSLKLTQLASVVCLWQSCFNLLLQYRVCLLKRIHFYNVFVCPFRYVKFPPRRGGAVGMGVVTKPPPPSYRCYRCGQPGHYINVCPTNGVCILLGYVHAQLLTY